MPQKRATPQSIDNYLRRKGSPLAGQGANFVRVGRKYGLDPYLLVAISGAESSFGKKAKNFNPFGWGPHIPFKSWDEGIETVGRGLKRGYIDQGLTTPEQIGRKWAPVGAGNDPTNLNSNWAGNVNRLLAELTGGFGGGAAPALSTVTPSGPPPDPQPRGLSAATRDLIFGDDPELAGVLSRLASSRASTPAPSASPVRPGRQRRGVNIPAGVKKGGALDTLLKELGLADAVTSGDRPGAITARGGRSDHSRPGKARDINPRDPQFQSIVAYAKANPGAFKDFIYAGLPWFIDEGKLHPISRLNKTDRDNHRDHLHVSFF